MSDIFKTLTAREELTTDQVISFAEILLEKNADQTLKADLLRALAAKGETANELTDFVNCFLTKARKPQIESALTDAPSIDVCGTGGDKLDLFNVSTTAMFVIAAGGAKVIKHGNRGVTSKSGSSDILAELGIPLQASDEELIDGLDAANICFLYAPAFHPSFKEVVAVRQQLAKEGVKTIFNLIGPMLNPANPDFQMVGVTDSARTYDFATILKNLGRKSVYAVTGFTNDGRPVDEFSTMGENSLYVSQQNGIIDNLSLNPLDLGISTSSLAELKGGSPSENANTLIAILSGKERGPKRDIVLLNAGAGLACCQLAPTIQDGVKLAKELIDSGKALTKLTALQATYKR